MNSMAFHWAILIIASVAAPSGVFAHEERRSLGRALQTTRSPSPPEDTSSERSPPPPGDTTSPVIIAPAPYPPPPVQRLAGLGEKCSFGGNKRSIPCERGLVCLPDGSPPPAAAPKSANSTNDTTYSAAVTGKCVYGLESIPCNTTTKCENQDDECLANDQQPVRNSDDPKQSNGVCAPRLPLVPEIYQGHLGEICGNQTTFPPKECKDCQGYSTVWRCDRSLTCLIDNRLESTRFTYFNDFTLRIVGTCQYPGTGDSCNNEKDCSGPLVCIKNTEGWYNASISFDVNECGLRGSGEKCNQDDPCLDPLVCLRQRGSNSDTRNGRCGTWGPNSPNNTVPIFYKVKAGDRCDQLDQSCPSGYFCSTDVPSSSSNQTSYLYCIATSSGNSLTPLLIGVAWALVVVFLATFVRL